MAIGGMTKGQARRQVNLKAKRAARRASGIVEIHKTNNKKAAGEFKSKKAQERLTGNKTPRGAKRKARREGLTHQVADAYRKAGLPAMSSFENKVAIPA